MNESRERGGERDAGPRPDPHPHQGAALDPGPGRAPGGDPSRDSGRAPGRDTYPDPYPRPDAGIGADLAERLLAAEAVVGAGPRVAALVRLLAAAAEGQPGREADERAALAAFREVYPYRTAAGTAVHGSRRAGPAASGPAASGPAASGPAASDPAVSVRTASGRKASGRTRTPPRGLGLARPAPGRRGRPRVVKALVGGFAAAFALGGVAIAAQTGNLPHPFRSGGGGGQQPSPYVSTAPVTPPQGARGLPDHGAGPGTVSPPAAPPPDTHASGYHRPGGPDHADGKAHELCASYTAALRHGKEPSAPVRAKLAEAAGGSARIAAYCAGPGAGAETGGGKGEDQDQGRAADVTASGSESGSGSGPESGSGSGSGSGSVPGTESTPVDGGSSSPPPDAPVTSAAAGAPTDAPAPEETLPPAFAPMPPRSPAPTGH